MNKMFMQFVLGIFLLIGVSINSQAASACYDTGAPCQLYNTLQQNPCCEFLIGMGCTGNADGPGTGLRCCFGNPGHQCSYDKQCCNSMICPAGNCCIIEGRACSGGGCCPGLECREGSCQKPWVFLKRGENCPNPDSNTTPERICDPWPAIPPGDKSSILKCGHYPDDTTNPYKCCSVQGVPCAINSHCCPGLWCLPDIRTNELKCAPPDTAYKKRGELCTIIQENPLIHDCFPGELQCVDGKCCSSIGKECGIGSHCCSGKCENNKCCAAEGAACNSNEACCSGFCRDNVCITPPSGVITSKR